MGQYFILSNCDKMEFLYSHDFDSGSKLMEHSYIGNGFVEVAEMLLSPKGAWHKNRIVWAGDYGTKGLFLPDNAPKMQEGGDFNLYGYIYEHGTNIFPDVVELEKQFPDKFKDYDAYKKATAKAVTKWLKKLPTKGRYLVNHTKKVCLDLTAEKGNGETWGDNKTPVIVHPLPLLTSEGNGRGGGDYSGTHMQLVGSWAGDVISIETEPTYTLNPPINFKEGQGSESNYKFVSNEPIEKIEKPKKAKKVEPIILSEEDKNFLAIPS